MTGERLLSRRELPASLPAKMAAIVPPPTASAKAAEDRLNSLLDEAYAAHEAVERLVERRPQWTIPTSPPAPAPLPPPLPPPPVVHSREDAPLSLVEPLPSRPDGFSRGGIFGTQGIARSVVPPSPGELSLPAQMAALQRRVDEISSGRRPALEEAGGEEATGRATAKRLTSSARASRTNARLGHDLAAARATILELEHENAALRSVLDRHRAAMREDASIRAQLEDARRARAEAELARNAEMKHSDEMRFQLRQAESEAERLRTLLAGTVWFDARM